MLMNPIMSMLGPLDLIATATVVNVVNTFIELGRFRVLPGTAIALGFGDFSGQDSAVGRVFIDIRDNGTAPGLVLNGMVRLDLENPRGRVVRTLFEMRSEALRTTQANRSLHIPLPELDAVAGEDWAIVLRWRADAAGTLGRVNTLIQLDVTSYDNIA